MLVGGVLFSESLHAMALTGVTRLGMVTPLGGVGSLPGGMLFGRAVMALRQGAGAVVAQRTNIQPRSWEVPTMPSPRPALTSVP